MRWSVSGRARVYCVLLAAFASTSTAAAATLELVSRVAPGLGSETASGFSATYFDHVSESGRWVLIESSAQDLVAGQTPSSFGSIFLFDQLTATMVMVAHVPGSSTTSGNGGPSSAYLSADGGWVVFMSAATDLVTGASDSNGGYDIFLWERATGTVRLVSHAAGNPTLAANQQSSLGGSGQAISGDGRYVVYTSGATDFEAGQVGPATWPQGILYDRLSDTNTLFTHVAGTPGVASNGFIQEPVVSRDGNYVAVNATATDLVAGVSASAFHNQIYLYDRVAGTFTLASHAAGVPLTAASDNSYRQLLSSDGRFVVYSSASADLVAGQTGTTSPGNTFVFDRTTGDNVLVSHTDGQPQDGAGAEQGSVISGDGGTVLWQEESGESRALHLYDRATNANVPVYSQTVSATQIGLTGGLSDDGTRALFISSSADVVAGQTGAFAVKNLFLYERGPATTSLVSHLAGNPLVGADGHVQLVPGLSADGSTAVFYTRASGLDGAHVDDNGRDDVVAADLGTLTNTLLTLRAGGTASVTARSSQISQSSMGVGRSAVQSTDGRWVVFVSQAHTLVAMTDPNGSDDVFLYDRDSGAITLVSHSTAGPSVAGNGGSDGAFMSADGSWIAFESTASDLVAGYSGAVTQGNIYLYERATGAIQLVSHAAGSPATAGDFPAVNPLIAAGGRFVVYGSRSTNLVAGQSDTNNGLDVFLYDRLTGQNELVSHAAAGLAVTGDQRAENPDLSAGGEFVAFQSGATNLVAGQVDTNGEADVFLYDRSTHTTTLVSHDHTAATTTGSNGGSDTPGITADGGFVVFQSWADNLIPGLVTSPGNVNIFLFDRRTGETRMVSHVPGNPQQAGDSGGAEPVITEGGSHVAYWSPGSNLVPGLTGNGNRQVYLYDRGSDTNQLLSRSAVDPAQGGNSFSHKISVSRDGRFVSFETQATDLIAGLTDPNAGQPDVMRWSATTGALEPMSLTTGGTTGNDGSRTAWLAADGTQALFLSVASDLVVGDGNQNNDVFLYRNAPPDDDVDGVSSDTEDDGPNGGDGNNDGTPDSQQANVTSLPSVVDGAYVTVETTPGTLGAVASIANPSPADAPPALEFPAGLLRFTVNDIAPGSATSVVLYFAPGSAPTGYYKYGPEPGNATPHWYSFLYNGTTGAVIAGNVVTLHLVDGQRGDDDLSANATIVDDGGPVMPLVIPGSPTFTSGPLTTFVVATAGSFTVTTTGSSVAALAVDQPLPSALTFVDNGDGTATLSGTPGTGTGGVHALTFRANNGIGGDVTQSFTLTIHQTSAITSANSAAFLPRAQGSFTVTATGHPVPSLQATGTLPLGVSLVDHGDGTATLGGTPAPGSGGTYPLTLTASNGVGSDAMQGFTLSVQQGLLFTLTPCRVFDSRAAFGGPGPLASGVVRLIAAAGLCGLPSSARSVAVNVTAVAPGSVGHLQMWAGDQPIPETSILNLRVGTTRANSAVVQLALDQSGTIAVRPLTADGSSLDLVIDVSAYFE